MSLHLLSIMSVVSMVALGISIYRRKATKIPLIISSILVGLCVIGCIVYVVTAPKTSSSSTKNNQFSDVFNKDPNKWTDEDKSYVDDLFSRIDNR